MLAQSDISIERVTAELVEDEVRLFADAFDQLLGAVARKRGGLLGDQLDGQDIKLPADLGKPIAASIEAWRRAGNVRRLWAGDADLWTGADEAQWLGWLSIVEEQRRRIDQLKGLAQDVRKEGFAHVLLLGMGGSSLGPEVLAETFGRQAGHPELWSSTRPTRRRSAQSRTGSTRRALCSGVEQIGHHAGAQYPEAILL